YSSDVGSNTNYIF
nr:immunoglobulin light chain junction region [Macaca mulatta]MPN80203.1 immunoglobulin light chain junction region [Macaca mulatta]